MAPIMDLDIAQSPEDEQLLTEAKATTARRVTFWAGAGLGLFALTACALVLAFPKSSQAPSSTFRELLADDELHDVIAKNLVAAGEKHDPASVKAQVGAHITLIAERERARFPEKHADLDAVELSPTERAAALNAMRTLSDPRMITAARSLLDAAKETALQSKDREDLKRRVAAKLAPQRAAFRQLADQLYPAALGGRKLQGQDVDVIPERTGVVSAFDEWKARSSARIVPKPDPNVVSKDAVKAQIGILAKLMRKKVAATSGRRLPEATDVSDTPYCLETEEGGHIPMKSFSLCIQYSFSNFSPSYFTQCVTEGLSGMTSMFGGEEDEGPTPCQQQGGYIDGQWTPNTR